MGVRRVLAAGAVALAAVAAPADAGRVPTPVLTATGGAQRGNPVTYSQTGRSSDNTCWTSIADGVPVDPDPVRHDAARGLRIHLARADKPVAVSVWIDRSPAGLPVATASESAYSLRPSTTRGRTTGWDVLLPPPGAGDLRLSLTARWRGDCGHDEGTWRFHVLAL